MKRKVFLVSLLIISLPVCCYPSKSIYSWGKNESASTVPTAIEHGEIYSRGMLGSRGRGSVEMMASAEEEYIEIKYKVTAGEILICSDIKLVQNERQYDEYDYEYTCDGWNCCETIMSGVAVYIKIYDFPGQFDFWSDFRLHFDLWEYQDYVDILGMTPPITTTTIPTPAPTTTTSSIPNDTTTTTAIVSSTTTSINACALELIYNEDSEELSLLRYLRDNVFSQTTEGQEIIRLYYEWSPVIVQAMEENEEFKEEIKEMIDGVLLLIGGEAE